MRSSSEVMADINRVSSELNIVTADISSMFYDGIKISNIYTRAKNLKTKVEDYDMSGGSKWEGDLYSDAVTKQGEMKTAVNNVESAILTLKTQLGTAKTVAEAKKQTLQTQLDNLWVEYNQAVAAEEAAAAAAAEAAGYSS